MQETCLRVPWCGPRRGQRWWGALFLGAATMRAALAVVLVLVAAAAPAAAIDNGIGYLPPMGWSAGVGALRCGLIM